MAPGAAHRSSTRSPGSGASTRETSIDPRDWGMIAPRPNSSDPWASNGPPSTIPSGSAGAAVLPTGSRGQLACTVRDERVDAQRRLGRLVDARPAARARRRRPARPTTARPATSGTECRSAASPGSRRRAHRGPRRPSRAARRSTAFTSPAPPRRERLASSTVSLTAAWSATPSEEQELEQRPVAAPRAPAGRALETGRADSRAVDVVERAFVAGSSRTPAPSPAPGRGDRAPRPRRAARGRRRRPARTRGARPRTRTRARTRRASGRRRARSVRGRRHPHPAPLEPVASKNSSPLIGRRPGGLHDQQLERLLRAPEHRSGADRGPGPGRHAAVGAHAGLPHPDGRAAGKRHVGADVRGQRPHDALELVGRSARVELAVFRPRSSRRR